MLAAHEWQRNRWRAAKVWAKEQQQQQKIELSTTFLYEQNKQMVSRNFSMWGRHAIFVPTSRIQCKIMFRLTHTTFDGCLFISSRLSDRIQFYSLACQRIERFFSCRHFTSKLRSFNWKLFTARVHHCRYSTLSLMFAFSSFFSHYHFDSDVWMKWRKKPHHFQSHFHMVFVANRSHIAQKKENKNSYASIHNSKLHSHSGVCLHAHLFAFWFPLVERERARHMEMLHHFDGSKPSIWCFQFGI